MPSKMTALRHRVGDDFRQIDAIHELHGEEQLAILRLAKVMHGHDPRMRQLCHRLRLQLESLLEIQVFAQNLARQQLDRHDPIERQLPCLLNDAHAAATDEVHHFIVRQDVVQSIATHVIVRRGRRRRGRGHRGECYVLSHAAQ